MDSFSQFIETNWASGGIPMDNYDLYYLSKFPKNVYAWRQALIYRYSPKTLQNPTPDPRDITLKFRDEQKGFNTFTAKNVSINYNQLIDKIRKSGYDPDRLNMKIDPAARLAKKLLATGQGTYHADADRLDSSNPDFKNVKKRPDLAGMEGKANDKIYLDDEDRKYLDSINKELSMFYMQALQLRYSSYFIEKFPNQVHVDIPFKSVFGRVIASKNAYVNVPYLQRRLETIREETGRDFIKEPLSRIASSRWLKTGFYMPYNAIGNAYQRKVIPSEPQNKLSPQPYSAYVPGFDRSAFIKKTANNLG